MPRNRIRWPETVAALCLLVVPAAANALTCEDIARIDSAEDTNGTFTLWSGCERIDAQVLSERWDELPEISQIVFSSLYQIPGQRYPDLSEDAYAYQLIGRKRSLLDTWAISTLQSANPTVIDHWRKKLWEYHEESPPRLTFEIDENSQCRAHKGTREELATIKLDFEIAMRYVTTTLKLTTFKFLSDYKTPSLAGLKVPEHLAEKCHPYSIVLEALDSTDVPAFIYEEENNAKKRLLRSGNVNLGLTFEQDVQREFPPHKTLSLEFFYAAAMQRFEVARVPPWPDFYAKVMGSGYFRTEIPIWSHMLDSRDLTVAKRGMELLDQGASYGDPLAQYNFARAYLDRQRSIHQTLWVQDDLKAEGYLKAAARSVPAARALLSQLAARTGNYPEAVKFALLGATQAAYPMPLVGLQRARELARFLDWSPIQRDEFADGIQSLCQHMYARVYSSQQAASSCEPLGGNLLKDWDARTELASLIDMIGAAGAGILTDATEQSFQNLRFGNFRALIIANENYENLTSLSAPKKDAVSLGSLLEEEFGFAVEYLFDATRVETLSRLNQLRDELTVEDNLLIYYAGHGAYDRALGEGYWQPVDATAQDDFTWIDTDRLTRRLESFRSRNIFVVADSCFSGAVFRSDEKITDAADASSEVLQSLIDRKTRVALTSGGLEPVIDSSSSGATSIFAQELQKALSVQEGVVSAGEIFQLVRDKVAARSKSEGYEQVPEFSPLYGAGHDGGDFVFRRLNE